MDLKPYLTLLQGIFNVLFWPTFILMLIDTSRLRVRRGCLGGGHFADMGRVGWAFSFVFLWFFAFPYYLKTRPKYVALHQPARLEAQAARLANQAAADAAHAAGDAHLICPHCQTKGTVTTALIESEGGLAGRNIDGIYFPVATMLETGQPASTILTQAHCGTCQSVWKF